MKADVFIDMVAGHGKQIKDTCASLPWHQKCVYLETLARVIEKQNVMDNANRLDVRLDKAQEQNLAECMEKRNAHA